MVPLKSEVWSEDSFTRPESSRRRRLSTSQFDSSRSASKSRQNRARAKNRDNGWFTAVIAVLVLFIVGASISSFRSSVESAFAQIGSTPYKVAVTVKPGDTLWTYAHRYGAPGSYILDRVDSIARQNALDPKGTLIPGQRLVIQVDNPVLLAKLQHTAKVASAE